MKQKLITLIYLIIFFTVPVKANLLAKNYGYNYCNQHNFYFFFLKVYDVYLCLDQAQYLKPQKIFDSNFSLIIHYDMNFEQKEIIDTSLKEIKKYYKISQDEETLVIQKLKTIFPKVNKKDIIEAKYNKTGTIDFYYNNSPIGKINDKKLAQMFLNIWLHQKNYYKEMTKNLYKKN